MIFFTIPWIFVIAVIVMTLGVGVGVLQFVLNHIVIISAIVWFPVVLWVISEWTDKKLSDEEKVEWVIFPLFLFPAYIGIVRLIVFVLDLMDRDLWGFFLYLLMMPVMFFLLIGACLGIACILTWLYKKVIKSKYVIVVISFLIVVPTTYFFWHLNW